MLDAWTEPVKMQLEIHSRNWQPTHTCSGAQNEAIHAHLKPRTGPYIACSGRVQSVLRDVLKLAQVVRLRIKRPLLRSKDGNGDCSYRDSDVEYLDSRA